MSYGGYGGDGYDGYGGGGGGGGDGGYGGYSGFGGGEDGGGGGGFMADMGSSQGGGGGGSARPKVDSITPVTIRQLKAAEETPEGTFLLDGRPIQKVILVARIVSINAKESNTQYQIEDSTGSFSASWWEDQGAPTQGFEQGMYVKVFGQVRVFSGRRSLSVFTMRTVEDHNEITHHDLEVILTHLQVTKGSANPMLRAGAATAGADSHAAPGAAAPMFNAFNPAPGGQPIQASGAGAAGGAGGNSDLVRHIMTIFNKPEVEDLESGISVRQAFMELQNLGVSATEAQVKKIVHELMQDGHLYSTVDDDHYKSTGETM